MPSNEIIFLKTIRSEAESLRMIPFIRWKGNKGFERTRLKEAKEMNYLDSKVCMDIYGEILKMLNEKEVDRAGINERLEKILLIYRGVESDTECAVRNLRRRWALYDVCKTAHSFVSPDWGEYHTVDWICLRSLVSAQMTMLRNL